MTTELDWESWLKSYRKQIKKDGLTMRNSQSKLIIGGESSTVIFSFESEDKRSTKPFKNKITVSLSKSKDFMYCHIEAYIEGENNTDTLYKYYDNIIEYIEKATLKVEKDSIFIRNNSDDSFEDYLKLLGFKNESEKSYEKKRRILLNELGNKEGFKIIDKIRTFLEEEKEKNPAFSFKPNHSSDWYAINYYFQGYEGVLILEKGKNDFFLVDTNVEFKQLIVSENTVDIMQNLLETVIEKNRLKRLMEPVRKHFDDFFNKKFYHLSETQTSVIFDFLLNHYTDLEIDQLILNYELTTVNSNSIHLFKLLDYYFVAKVRAETVSCYDKDQLDAAQHEYKHLVRKQMEEILKTQLEIFRQN